jgi:hypothetical protein
MVAARSVLCSRNVYMPSVPGIRSPLPATAGSYLQRMSLADVTDGPRVGERLIRYIRCRIRCRFLRAILVVLTRRNRALFGRGRRLDSYA